MHSKILQYIQVWELRSNHVYSVRIMRHVLARNSVICNCLKFWHELPEDLKEAPTNKSFKQALKTYLVTSSVPKLNFLAFICLLNLFFDNWYGMPSAFLDESPSCYDVLLWFNVYATLIFPTLYAYYALCSLILHLFVLVFLHWGGTRCAGHALEAFHITFMFHQLTWIIDHLHFNVPE